jgi:hypothetical protein
VTVNRVLKGPDGPVEVILKAADAPRVAGKFLLGRPVLDAARLVLTFDDAAAFHKDIALAHGLRPLGGGWCEIVHPARTVRLSGGSQAFGREPDRELTLRCFRECLAGYDCQEVD